MRASARVLAVLLSVCLVLTPLEQGFAQAPPVAAQAAQAGSVTAQLPEGTITRPGQQLATDVGAAVLWNDLVETAVRGRVRITLGDGSLLNVGSQSSLRVVQHQTQTRQTDLTLTFGKMRTRLRQLDSGQRFELRTNTAVLGVIGTDFFVEAAGTFTRIIVYEGLLLVRNINPGISGEQRVGAGSVVMVFADQPPSPPQRSEQSAVDQSVDDTAIGEALPRPPGAAPGAAAQGKFLGLSWPWVVVIAATATAIGIGVASGGGASGCSVPPPALTTGTGAPGLSSSSTCPALQTGLKKSK